MPVEKSGIPYQQLITNSISQIHLVPVIVQKLKILKSNLPREAKSSTVTQPCHVPHHFFIISSLMQFHTKQCSV